jgi:hypothetical protein
LITEISCGAAVLSSVTGLLYAATVTAVALTASLSRDPYRRADARRALRILLRRRNKAE